MKLFNTCMTIKVYVNKNIEAETEKEALEIMKNEIEDTFPMSEDDTPHEAYWFLDEDADKRYVKKDEFVEENTEEF